jgi:NitT/TauT family transport system ATP-binding protein
MKQTRAEFARVALAAHRAEGGASERTMIQLSGLGLAFGGTWVLKDIDLTIQRGQFVALVGTSGCGKTTLLNVVSGLVRGTAGSVMIDGTAITGPRPSTGYMSARDALLPWRSALANVEFGLELRGVPKAVRTEKARYWLEQVGLSHAADKYRSQLSQGMRQRLAFARTLAIDPDLILLDEPFAALDAQTKEELQPKFLQLWEGSGRTVILVTHDISEAISMADRVIVLGRGKGIVLDVPVTLPRPRNIADLIDVPEYRDIRHRVRDALMA